MSAALHWVLRIAALSLSHSLPFFRRGAIIFVNARSSHLLQPRCSSEDASLRRINENVLSTASAPLRGFPDRRGVALSTSPGRNEVER